MKALMGIKVLAMVLIIVCGVWAQQHIPLVAVLPFEVRTGVSQQDAETTTEVFIGELQTQGSRRIRILTRASADFARVLEEMQFQRTDWASQETAAQIGERLGAEFVISGQFSKLGQSTVWIARMINVETGEVVSNARETIISVDEVLEKMPSFTKQIMGNLFLGQTRQEAEANRQAEIRRQEEHRRRAQADRYLEQMKHEEARKQAALKQAEMDKVQAEIKSDKNLKTTGVLLTLSGGTLLAIGIPLIVNNNDLYGNVSAWTTGLTMTTVGGVSFPLGVFCWRFGAVLERQGREKLKNLSAYIAPNGAGFAWNF